MKYAILTFGCRVNQADSLAIEEQLRANGLTEAPAERADLLVVNSCSVTASADQGTRQAVRRIVRANPTVQIVVTGCYATRDAETVRELPNVVQVLRNADKDDLVAAIAPHVELTTPQRFGDGDGPCGGRLAPGVAGRTAFTLRVQTGCDEHCSYCIIPTTRGAGRSRPARLVAADLERAIVAGYKEIAITGVHLGSYGRDLEDGSSLVALVRMLSEWPDDVLFRISSLEPMDCHTEIVEHIASSSRLAPHFHLPLQHGSDDVLRAMRRPYTVSYYRSLVERIRTALPHASIGSDVIAGFPGETDAHHRDMRETLEQLPLSYLHVFPYSDRPGTAAAVLHPKVDGSAIRDRARELREIGEAMTRRFKASQAGRTARGLTVDDGRNVVTDNYLKVRLNAPRPRNEWVQVRIESGDRCSFVAAGFDIRPQS